MTQGPKQTYEAWRITYQSSELAARSAFDTAEMLQQELLKARATISNLERDELTAITQRDDASDFIDKILDEVLGQDRHEWTSAYDRDDAFADVEAKMLALKSSKCLHQIAEPAEPSATYGMHFGDRVLHIGGRENAAGYIEFGSVEAVRVLVGQVLRDLPGGAPGFALAATQPTEAARSVLAERARQIAAEGWTPEKDDAYNPGVLAEAGGIYALHAFDPFRAKEAPEGWPWSPGWWKPKDPRSNLVKAGALILAEIERIDRTYVAQAKQGGAA